MKNATLRLWLAPLGLACLVLMAACSSDPDGSCAVDTDCDDGDACTVGTCGSDGLCAYQPATCDDGLFCNGAESCDSNAGCQAGTPPALDDGVGCTLDSCDEDADMVVHAPDHGSCADGVFCNGAEVCDSQAGCQPGEPVGDGIDCTVDVCEEAAQTITSTADDSACDDGLFCNGAESCDEAAGCLAGNPPGDGIGCTDDVCDEATDTVMNVPNDSLCDDGDTCTTTDACDPVLDCVYIADVDPTCGTCENCGFEAGDYTSWDTADLANPLDPLSVESLGGGDALGVFWTVDPTEGMYAAYHGFDGDGPGTIEIGQDITIHPSVMSATLTFDYRVGWDTTFGATLPRAFEVSIEPSGGGMPLQTDVIMTVNPGETMTDTGEELGSVDLTDYIGQTVYVRFIWDVPEANTGPGAFQLDNIAVTTP